MAYWSGKKRQKLLPMFYLEIITRMVYCHSAIRKVWVRWFCTTASQPKIVSEVFNDNVSGGYDPLYPFGFGLSYTRFEYSDIQLSSPDLKGNGKLTVSITVKNTGNRDGKHTVELYTHDMYASITPNMKRLRAFQKISLKAGENKMVTFTLDKNDLAFVNEKLKTVTEPGDFEIMIGNKKAKFTYQENNLKGF